jgi:hypothetical protein
VHQDGHDLADAVASVLRARAVPVARVTAHDFLRPRSLRLEHGRDDPLASYESWFDVAALRREVLDRLGPGGDGSWLPALRDPVTDRSVRNPRQTAPAGTVAVLDGPFLLRPELTGALDLVIHLEVSRPARARRAPAGDHDLACAAWDHYLHSCDPASRAALVVRFDHPRRPAVR